MYIPFLNALFPSGSPYIIFRYMYVQLNILLVILHLVSQPPPSPPSPVFSDLTPPVFFSFSFLSITPSSLFIFTIGYNPLPRPESTIYMSHVFYALVFHNNIP